MFTNAKAPPGKSPDSAFSIIAIRYFLLLVVITSVVVLGG
jgi:hypothetical protein